MKTEEIRKYIEEADIEGRKYVAFVALSLTHIPELLDIENGAEGLAEIKNFLEDIGMPVTYAYQLRGFMKLENELKRLGFIIKEDS